jgi:hypothetical protein
MAARRWRLILALGVSALALWCGGRVAPAPVAAAQLASSYGAEVVTKPGSSSGPVDTLPSGGAGPTAESPALTPFTVFTDAAPTVEATPTPAGPGVYSGLTVTVTNWLTDEHAPPQLVLLPDDGTDIGMPLDATLDTG